VSNCIVSETFLKHVSTSLLAKLKGVRRASFLLAILGALLVYGPTIATVAENGTPDSEFSGSGAHSIVILLPDGQRMLCECYDAQRCSQGFRVPAITPRPDPAVWSMFVAVRNVLLLRSATAEVAFPMAAGRAAMAANVELVAAVSPLGEISIAPALRVLPSGQYSLDVTRNGQPAASIPAAAQPLNWTAGQTVAQVRVDAPGLYRIRVSDQTNVPRIEVEVLAIAPDSVATEAARLKQMRDAIMQWNHIHGGWDLHGFLRAYLESRTAALSQG
jgi:hypothetical protein